MSEGMCVSIHYHRRDTEPEALIQRLRGIASVTYRTVDDALVCLIEPSLATSDALPDIADQIAAMHLMSDEALWAAAQPRLAAADQRRLRQLNHAGGERNLTRAEEAESTALIEACLRSMLLRAQALATLKQRGHEITRTLVQKQVIDYGAHGFNPIAQRSSRPCQLHLRILSNP